MKYSIDTYRLYQNEKYLRNVLKTCEMASEYMRTHRNETMPAGEFNHVSPENNIALYDLFIDKLQNTKYNIRLSSLPEKLRNARQIFESMTVVKQCFVLQQVLNLFTCNRTTADLKALELGGQVGVISTSRMVSGYSSAKLISQSVTGLFEIERDLLK